MVKFLFKHWIGQTRWGLEGITCITSTSVGWWGKFVVNTVIPTCWNHAFVLKRAKAPEFPCSLDLSHIFRRYSNESKKCPPTSINSRNVIKSVNIKSNRLSEWMWIVLSHMSFSLFSRLQYKHLKWMVTIPVIGEVARGCSPLDRTKIRFIRAVFWKNNTNFSCCFQDLFGFLWQRICSPSKFEAIKKFFIFPRSTLFGNAVARARFLMQYGKWSWVD